MTSDASNLPKHVSTPLIEGRVAPPFDDPVAASLRGFGPLGLLAILLIILASVFKPLSAILVLVWAWRSHTPWREIGYVRPNSWIGSLAVGVVFGCALKLLMKVIVMPLFGAPAINPAYHYLIGNRAALPGMVFTMIVGAGFAEETLFRRLYPFRCRPAPKADANLPWQGAPSARHATSLRLLGHEMTSDVLEIRSFRKTKI